MQLKYIFESVDMGEEIIAVPIGDNSSDLKGVLKLNKPGKEIFDYLKEETTEDAIVDSLAANYDNDREVLSEYVHSVIIKLRELNLIV